MIVGSLSSGVDRLRVLEKKVGGQSLGAREELRTWWREFGGWTLQVCVSCKRREEREVGERMGDVDFVGKTPLAVLGVEGEKTEVTGRKCVCEE